MPNGRPPPPCTEKASNPGRTSKTPLFTASAVSTRRKLLPKAGGADTLPIPWTCPVCRRRMCRLASHHQYAKDVAIKSSKLFVSSEPRCLIVSRTGKPNPRSQLFLEKSGSRTDPFARYPIKMTSELDQLLRQCKSKCNT